MSDLAENSLQWRNRAAEARLKAERMHYPDARRSMLEIAEQYDVLARRAEMRLAAKVSAIVSG